MAVDVKPNDSPAATRRTDRTVTLSANWLAFSCRITFATRDPHQWAKAFDVAAHSAQSTK